MANFEHEFRHKTISKIQIQLHTIIITTSILILVSSSNANPTQLGILMITSACIAIPLSIFILMKFHRTLIRINDLALTIEKKYLWRNTKNSFNFSELNDLSIITDSKTKTIQLEYYFPNGEKQLFEIMAEPNKIKHDSDHRNAMRCIEIIRENTVSKL